MTQQEKAREKYEKIAKAIVNKWGYEEKTWWGPIAQAIEVAVADAVRSAVAEERERCAKIAENWHEKGWECYTCGGSGIANAIREEKR